MKDHAVFGIAAGTAILGLAVLLFTAINTKVPVAGVASRTGSHPEIYGSDVCRFVTADLSKPIQQCVEEGRLHCERLNPSSPTGPMSLCYLACYRYVRDQCEYSHSKVSNNWRSRYG